MTKQRYRNGQKNVGGLLTGAGMQKHDDEDTLELDDP